MATETKRSLQTCSVLNIGDELDLDVVFTECMSLICISCLPHKHRLLRTLQDLKRWLSLHEFASYQLRATSRDCMTHMLRL